MEKENKILFQISYDGETDSYKYITNEMTHQEFLAFLMFLKLVCEELENDVYHDMICGKKHIRGDDEDGDIN